jgi:holo-[acyl-carrier protein] synthase
MITQEHINLVGAKLGNDIVFLPGFRESLCSGFIRRVYSEQEKEYCEQFSDPVLRYASTFAAKEAVYKAVKQWDDTLLLPWKKIVIRRSKASGQPTVVVNVERCRAFQISLSIAHDGDYVWAIVACYEEKR